MQLVPVKLDRIVTNHRTHRPGASCAVPASHPHSFNTMSPTLKKNETPPLGLANPAVTSMSFVLHRLGAPDRLGQQNPGKIKRRDHAPQLDGFCKGAAPQRAMASFRSPRLSTHVCDRFCCGAFTFRNRKIETQLNNPPLYPPSTFQPLQQSQEDLPPDRVMSLLIRHGQQTPFASEAGPPSLPLLLSDPPTTQLTIFQAPALAGRSWM